MLAAQTYYPWSPLHPRGDDTKPRTDEIQQQNANLMNGEPESNSNDGYQVLGGLVQRSSEDEWESPQLGLGTLLVS